MHTCLYSSIPAHTHIYAHTLLTHLFICFCNFSLLSCFIRLATWQEERVGRRQRRKTWQSSRFFFSSIVGSPLVPPCAHTHTYTLTLLLPQLSHLATHWPRLHRCRLWKGRQGNTLRDIWGKQTFLSRCFKKCYITGSNRCVKWTKELKLAGLILVTY